jgi:small conductance mechanosensitive channel
MVFQSISDYFLFFYDWLQYNILNILYSAIFALIVIIILQVITKELKKLSRGDRIDSNVVLLINRIITWGGYLVIIGFVFSQFGLKIQTLVGLTAVVGGTVVGFAAMNTLGNAISGLIVMTSRPLGIGDRILFEGEFVDVIEIDLIYTKMKNTDNVMISVPNQMLLQREITNFGKNQPIRRSCSITADFREPSEKVEKALLEAVEESNEVSGTSEPYVWVTEIGNYAIEYTLYYFVTNLKEVNRIDSVVRRNVLVTFEKYGIDLSTPTLIKSVS